MDKPEYENADANPYASWAPPEVSDPEDANKLEWIQGSIPVLDEVIAWFDDEIKTWSDPSVIEGVNASSNAEDVKLAVMFAQNMIKSYKYKRNQFIARFDDYKKKPVEDQKDTA